MMEEEYYTKEFQTNFIKLAAKLSSMVKSKDGFLFEPVKITGKGKGFYYSLSDKCFMWVDKDLEWYHIYSVDPDDKGRLCLYSPYIFASGIICRVPEEEVEFIGFN
jgi:hypothetical protein